MDLFTLLKDVFSTLGGFGFLVGIIVLYKTGVLNFLLEWKRNGSKNGNLGKEIIDRLEELEINHLHGVSDGLKRVEEAIHQLDSGNRLNFTTIHNRLNEIAEGLAYLKAKLND